MKNRILVGISLALSVFAFYALDLLNADWAYYILGVTVIAEIWILVVNKQNWAVKLGYYSIFIALLTAAIGLGLGYVLPKGHMGFGPAFAAVVIGVIASGFLVAVSCLGFVAGAILPTKTTTTSPNP